MSASNANSASASTSKPPSKPNKNDSPSLDKNTIFTPSVITMTIHMPIAHVGKRLTEHMLGHVVRRCEGLCIEEGYVKSGSAKILSHSCGRAYGDTVMYKATVECLICYPVEGMLVSCYAKDITRAGIRAELYASEVAEHDTPSLSKSTPLMIFIARDHHYNSSDINSVLKGDQIEVKIIGVRFELNDPFISVIAEYVRTVPA